MDKILKKTVNYLNYFCVEVKDRSFGSPGNRKATKFFYNTIKDLGWQLP